ncbi:SDR family oxidoreductase [Kibdelosporangium philippinense]|uniref:SDR family oxidoreductase n=1 Tax=Kibdelosporangium philippinense TaxID=211113 RepID=A0ABS8Z368_9PSEU|nr:SDR family oxidoreductase [Kibdelosporangium philippinense]MCE7002250.1 SDR family oxidoreductase [Kibdelosporangium philippinense]
MTSLPGKVAVITGATSGIGARVAELFVSEGTRQAPDGLPAVRQHHQHGQHGGKAAGWSGLDYSTAKAAVIHLTRCAAVDLAQHAVRVNSVSPGFVPTGIFAKGGGLDPSMADTTAEKLAAGTTTLTAGVQPIEEIVTTDDVAAAVLWFASDASRLVTGQDIGVDGGVSAGRPLSALWTDRTRIRETLTS